MAWEFQARDGPPLGRPLKAQEAKTVKAEKVKDVPSRLYTYGNIHKDICLSYQRIEM